MISFNDVDYSVSVKEGVLQGFSYNMNEEYHNFIYDLQAINHHLDAVDFISDLLKLVALKDWGYLTMALPYSVVREEKAYTIKDIKLDLKKI